MTPDKVLEALRGALPAATLVLGRGAWPLVGQAAEEHWLLKYDLNAGGSQEVREGAWLLPLHGDVRVYALCLDKAAEQAQERLLTILEEPPPGTQFVLAATERPLETIVSRCWVLVLGPEPGEPVPPLPADASMVSAAVKAARSGPQRALAQVLRSWQPVHAQLLAAWALEAATGRWRQFRPGSVPGVSRSQAMGLLAELSKYPVVTKLAAQVALERTFSRA